MLCQQYKANYRYALLDNMSHEHLISGPNSCIESTVMSNKHQEVHVWRLEGKGKRDE